MVSAAGISRSPPGLGSARGGLGRHALRREFRNRTKTVLETLVWVEPRNRAIMPLNQFHMSRSLRRSLRSGRFHVTHDTDFAGVIRACANREETWINAEIEQAMLALHGSGHAHSIEVWQAGELVGGLYGVKLGRAFFGESMFSRATDAFMDFAGMDAGLGEHHRREFVVSAPAVVLAAALAIPLATAGGAPRQRRIAMVFQSYALYPHLTVFGNIVFPLKAVRVPKVDRKTKAEWAAGLLGIGHLLNRRPRELSGGERQRVALARAIVREPSLFLLDEPLSNLDAKLRASAREELEQFQKRIGTTTLYVTHDQVEAMAMGDRVVVMNKGSVRQIGTPAEVAEMDQRLSGGDMSLAGEILRKLPDLANRLRWFLTNRPQPLAVGSTITRFAAPVRALRDVRPMTVGGVDVDGLRSDADAAGLGQSVSVSGGRSRDVTSLSQSACHSTANVSSNRSGRR